MSRPTPHPTEDDLVLHHYGEADAPAGVEEHLAECEACRAAYGALRDTLSAVEADPAPERGGAYGAGVWTRIRPRIERKPILRRVVVPLGLAASLLVAFLLGRHTQPPAVAPSAEAVRERILLVAVGDHLERSQMVLIELAHASGDGTVDISAERQWAESLLGANRLYRLSAERAGEAAVASVLGDLERVLLEIAHGPSEVSSRELAALQERLEARGLLFRVRVIGSSVRERQKEIVRTGGTVS